MSVRKWLPRDYSRAHRGLTERLGEEASTDAKITNFCSWGRGANRKARVKLDVGVELSHSSEVKNSTGCWCTVQSPSWRRQTAADVGCSGSESRAKLACVAQSWASVCGSLAPTRWSEDRLLEAADINVLGGLLLLGLGKSVRPFPWSGVFNTFSSLVFLMQF